MSSYKARYQGSNEEVLSEGAWPPQLHAFLIIFTPRITFFAICMNVLPDPQSAKRGALWGFVIGGRESIISVFSSFWGIA